MINQDLHTANSGVSVKERLACYAEFAKLRLAALVVFSALVSYFMAAESIDWVKILALIFGGFAITGASNGFNQVIERDLDKLMDRTKGRPLPTDRMSVKEGLSVAVVMGVFGITVLWYFLNPLSGILGTLALVLYVAIYTPMKRISPVAVFVGAFPGAIPPMLGYVAESGTFGLTPGLLFLIQFMWQFPHFWAIAWKCHDDYAKAGFRLLPSAGGKDKRSAMINLVYTLGLIPVSLSPFIFGITGVVSAVVVGVAGVWFFWKSVKLYKSCSDEDATKLMFASFIYLPVVQLALMFDKV